jgi:predicted nucleic acid-binding protein
LIAYIDSSVLVRLVLRAPDPLRDWALLDRGVASPLLRIECYRTLDRHWLEGELDEEELREKQLIVDQTIAGFDRCPLDEQVQELASKPLPTILGTLDALHLASAIIYRKQQPRDERPLVIATHDRAFAKAARAMHFDVIGAPR